ncbi:type ISP restriction/modification enzyme [Calditrichota bacterium LG25]
MQKYFKSIKDKIEQSTEYTLRTDLENLLNEIKPRKTIKIIQENKKIENQTFGRPDFKVTENDLEIGYIETKPYNDDLSVYIATPQLKRYLSVIPNLLFTNYRDFILFRNGVLILKSTLIIKGEKKLQDSNIEKTKQVFDEFFNAKIQIIEKTEKLSILLAKHAQYLHDEIEEFWNGNEKTPFKEKLQGLYNLFLETLIEDLTPADFIDAYAQTVTYGLLLSALNANKKIDKSNFIEFIPKSLSIFEEIFGLLRLSNIPDGISWIIDKLFIILNNTNYAEIQKELSFAYKNGREFEDPYIYFYENFLKAYNQEKRVEKGVFYTPAAVVHFIVKVIQQSLIRDFKKSGLDDDSISLLDFATGTGTFLLEAYKTALANVDKGQKNGFIRNNLLSHFFGFEYLIAPYTISHLKLSKYLAEEGFTFQNADRVKVYLTDTLDDAHYQRNPLFPYISDEGEQATKIKLEKKVWIVLGNPPYSNYSKNKKPFIQTLINDYKKDLNETKINLDDDYIKFIRFAQAKIEGAKYSYRKGKNTVNGEINGAGQGIIGIITNNSYLNGITHWAMRKSLLSTFDKIYILNLHGNSNIGEPDKNVFDVKVGVSIALFIKLPKPLKEKEVWYYSTLDNGIISRKDKYDFLYDNYLDTIDWKRIYPKEPYYWFVEKNLEHQTDYNSAISLTEIFKLSKSGIKTDRDGLFIDMDKANLENRIKILLSGKFDENFIEKFNVKNSGSYKLLDKIQNKRFNKNCIQLIQYRPFDFRFIYYQVGLTSRPAYEVHHNFIDYENIGLVFKRQNKKVPFSYAFVTETIVESCLFESAYANNVVAPLYLYPEKKEKDVNQLKADFGEPKVEKEVNFTEEFRNYIKELYSDEPTPEEIFAYIYAVLYAPAYRTKYQEHLIIDFPKIPFTKNKEMFDKIAKLGKELIENHLLKRSYQRDEMPVFAVEGNNIIDSYHYDERKQRLYINKKQYFDQFLQSVWEYKIGGYQVFDKYLNARKGLALSYEEINHLKKVAASIRKTFDIQQMIDTLCAVWI